MSENQQKWILAIVFVLVGIGIIVYGVFSANGTSEFKKNAVETTATVTKIRSEIDAENHVTYQIYVTYSVDGKNYNEYYTSSRKDANEGSQIKVYYDKNNPEKMRVTLSKSSEHFLIVLGFVFGAIGIGLTLRKETS